MKNGYWIVKDNILQIAVDKETYIPDALEVYLAVFDKQSSIKNIQLATPPTDLENLTFSKYPLDVAIELKLGENAQIELYIKLESTKISVFVEDFFSRTADHIIINNVWYPFVHGVHGELITALKSLGVENNGCITLKQYIQIQELGFWKIRDLTPEKMEAESFSKKLPPIHCSKTFIGNLYPYQDIGLRWLSYLDNQNIGCILADEMGLGKTIQVIAILANHMNEDDPCLVISPATLLENWRREIRKFAPLLHTLVHQGSNRSGFAHNFLDYDVIISSYETVLRDRYMLKMIKWNIIVLDEAQAIKNPDAKRTNAVKMLPRRQAIAMSGTPVQNHLMDLWSISDFVFPGLLGARSSFEKENEMNIESALRVKEKISPIMLRRRVKEVAQDLPELIDIPQPLIMDQKSVIEYEAIREAILAEYGENATLVVLQKLRMYCAHRCLIFDYVTNVTDNSAKYNRLLEILEEIVENNEKLLIFSTWTKMIDTILKDILIRYRIYINKIDGRTGVEERQNIVDQFNSVSTPGVLILNPIAAGVGLNITGANHVIHYNPEWNPAVVDQATARAYRRGQDRPVTVHRLYYVNTIEDVINERLEFKREIADTAVVGVKGQEDDIKYLIKALHVSPKI